MFSCEIVYEYGYTCTPPTTDIQPRVAQKAVTIGRVDEIRETEPENPLVKPTNKNYSYKS